MKKSVVVIVVLFIIVEIGLFYTIEMIQNKKIEQYLADKTKQKEVEYNTVYDYSKRLSWIIYKDNIDKPEILSILYKNITQPSLEDQNRELLKQKLLPLYNVVSQQNIKQFHFHLPNGDSFLRFHKIDKYGDNLLKTRQTVKYVIENKKPIDGFEVGKVFHGFRFVYPLFYNNLYVGSVEVSFSSEYILSVFARNFKLFGNILIKNTILDEKILSEFKKYYKSSPIEGFSITSLSQERKVNNKFTKKYLFNSSKKFKQNISNKFKEV